MQLDLRGRFLVPVAGRFQRLRYNSAVIGTVLYFTVLILLPVIWLVVVSLEQGPLVFWRSLATPEAGHAFLMTFLTSAVALVLNTIFGLLLAIVMVRQRFRGQGFINALIDLPFAVSPVVAGLMLLLLYGPHGWFGPALESLGLKVTYALPGMILATTFVTLPFVVREVAPVLQEAGEDQELAAYTLGASPLMTFFRVTIPNVRWGLLYGVTLTLSRALGEFGALLVVSGNVIGRTQTATLHVHQAYTDYDIPAATSASVALAGISFVLLLAAEAIRRHAERRRRR